MTDDVHTFTSTIRFCGLFKPLQLPGSPSQPIIRYGCTVNADDVPDALSEHTARKPISRQYTELRPELAGSVWCHLSQRHAPRIVLTNGMGGISELIRICDMAEATNITPDSLLNEIPATLAVRPIEFIDAGYLTGRPRQVKTLQVLAVQVTYDDLVKRFDHLQKEYFR